MQEQSPIIQTLDASQDGARHVGVYLDKLTDTDKTSIEVMRQ